MKHTIFFLGALALLLVITQVANANVYGDQIQPVDTIPLDFDDTGKVVYPGVTFTVTVHAEAVEPIGIAGAGVSINGLVFGIDDAPGASIINPKVALYMGGHVYEIGSFGARTMFDAVFEFTIYCDNDSDGYAEMVVRAVPYGYEHTYVIPDKAVNIYYYEESLSAPVIGDIVRGNVEIGRIEEFTHCGDYGGQLPSPGESPNEEPWYHDWKLMLILVGVGLVALIGVLIITNVYTVLKPR